MLNVYDHLEDDLGDDDEYTDEENDEIIGNIEHKLT